MASPNSDSQHNPDPLPSPENFSLVLGGPLFQLLRRAHLSDDALHMVRRRIVVLSLFTWLPLLVFSALGRTALGGDVAVPFLFDVEVNARFLLGLPLLIMAELLVHQRMRIVVAQFLDRRLIPDEGRSQYDAALTGAFRLRNSVLAEVLLIALVYGVNVQVWRHFVALDTSTWYAVPTATGTRLTLTGIWYAYVSLPIFQFLLLRWYWRLIIWARFLWHVSRIQLQLIPTHPDRVGGLGFLSGTVFAFMPLVAAHGVLLAGMIANRIFYLGAGLPQFQLEAAAMVFFLLIIVLGPLLVFSPQLARTKRAGSREYGTLAQRYVREFDVKWLRGGAPPDAPLVGSGDIQSLADLANSYGVIGEMRLAPFNRGSVVSLAVAALLPAAPLILTVIPLEKLLRTLVGVIL
jgi:hypothetical protein